MKGVCDACNEISDVIWKDVPAKTLGAGTVGKELICKDGCKQITNNGRSSGISQDTRRMR